LEIAAVDRELGVIVPGASAQLLAIDELAEAVEEAAFAGGDGNARERRLEPQYRQLAGRVGRTLMPTPIGFTSLAAS